MQATEKMLSAAHQAYLDCDGDSFDFVSAAVEAALAMQAKERENEARPYLIAYTWTTGRASGFGHQPIDITGPLTGKTVKELAGWIAQGSQFPGAAVTIMNIIPLEG